MVCQGDDLDIEVGPHRERHDRIMDGRRIRGFPEAPVRPTPGDAPEPPDDAGIGELARPGTLALDPPVSLRLVAVGRPGDLDVHQELHVSPPSSGACARAVGGPVSIMARRCRSYPWEGRWLASRSRCPSSGMTWRAAASARG